MPSPFIIIIPARYASSRLPGKPLLDINGKPLLQHVFETASDSDAKAIYIATDDDRIAAAVNSFGGQVIMTSAEHESGTDRLAEAVELLNIAADEIIVNLQGDEYGLPVTLLNQVATALHNNPQKQMATLYETITSLEEYNNPDVVKVIANKNNSALYFSRSPIPATRQTGLPVSVYRHIGLYAYRADYLNVFTQLPACELEQTEALEQLRVLYYGGEIHIEVAVDQSGVGVDTEADLELARTGRVYLAR